MRKSGNGIIGDIRTAAGTIRVRVFSEPGSKGASITLLPDGADGGEIDLATVASAEGGTPGIPGAEEGDVEVTAYTDPCTEEHTFRGIVKKKEAIDAAAGEGGEDFPGPGNVIAPLTPGTETVRAVLYGGKTTMRRLPTDGQNPPCRPGDVFYLREAWRFIRCAGKCGYACAGTKPKVKDGDLGCYLYEADDPGPSFPPDDGQWNPAATMPKDAARIWLKVTDVRLGRLNDMTEGDAKREGFVNNVMSPDGKCALRKFMDAWDAALDDDGRKRYGWEANPKVWTVSFERCREMEEEPVAW